MSPIVTKSTHAVADRIDNHGDSMRAIGYKHSRPIDQADSPSTSDRSPRKGAISWSR
jgi:hypothetical protein